MQCSTSENGSVNNKRPVYEPPANQFTVPGQFNASDLVYSVQLHRTGSTQSAPIYELGSAQKLQLAFDLLETDSRQLSIRFSHHNPDWSESNLSENFFKDGLYGLRIPVGSVNTTDRPYYRSYQYRFPNDDIEFLASGNYLLNVEDTNTGDFLFSVPFFVTENEGSIRSQVETITVPRREGRISHLPRSIFETPEYIQTPQFDLEFYYVQNQFWGRARQADELDTSTQGEVMFELLRDQAFIGDYEFQFLSLTSLSQQAPQIFAFDPSEIPPKVILYDDVQGFSASRSQIPGSRLGSPESGSGARYANVHFRFDPSTTIPQNAGLYLVGDFNDWSLRSSYRLQYHAGSDRWRTNGFIKTGTYSYKYVFLENNRIRDLALDDSFTRNSQEYHALVYFRDPDRFYYRLLQINNFFENS